MLSSSAAMLPGTAASWSLAIGPDDLGEHLDPLALQRRHAGVDHYLLALAGLGLVLDSDEHRFDAADVFLAVGQKAGVRLGLGPADALDRNVGHRHERPASAAKRVVDLVLRQ